MKNSIPNLYKQFEKYPELTQAVMSEEGRWYVLPTIDENLDYEKVLGVRMDVLEELEYSHNSIRTIDDFADLLLAARNSINGMIKIPWLPVGPSTDLLSVDPEAFGVGGTDKIYWDGNKFTYGPSTSEYFVYLRLLALAYQTKAIPANMFNRNEDTNKRSFFGGAGAIYVRSEKDMLGADRTKLVANGFDSAIYRPIVPPPIGRKSYTPRRLHVLDTSTIRAINRNTSRLHEITRFLDFCYGDRGKHLIYWGRENIHWNFENGSPNWLIQTPFNRNTNTYKTTGVSLGLFGSWLSLILPNTIKDAQYGKLHADLTTTRLPDLQKPSPMLPFTQSEKQELDLIGFPEDKITSTKFYKGVPKTSNHNTGYKGRTAIHEIMEINSEVRNMIYKNADQDELFQQAKKNGMTTLREAGIGKVASGETTISEILRSTVQDN